ncbi:uncharacterized protein LOC62_02G003218 [Vanrija pseudolonga]|uniref:Uncharacterized protein n=1 Tax=Vanrija pseudolonga TaxID=143232 RepID=A0AAF0Y3M8_9TREE|nr:hypothetical protein LOC62_02G003218 [Vanrija pseudolonga]
MVMSHRHAVEYLKKRKQEGLIAGAYAPALVDCHEGVLLHTSFVRDLLEFCQRHDVVVLMEEHYLDTTQQETRPAAVLVIMDARSGSATSEVMDSIRSLAKYRLGKTYASALLNPTQRIHQA